jgi:haloalkane dehalogenase
MHYVDTGPVGAPVVLLLHGQPTWSYLYRDTLSTLAGRGLRAIAPDHIGYGRSDKPDEPSEYTFDRHIDALADLVTALDLQEVTLVAQDWGGPIGLAVLARHPDRFARVVATNTVLHTSDADLDGRLAWANHRGSDGRVVLQEALVDYVRFCQRAPELQASSFVEAVAGPLTADVRAAYDAPYPDRRFQAGLKQMTSLIPLTGNDPGAAINRHTMAVLATWTRPFLTAYSDGDPATGGWDSVFRDGVPGAVGQPHVTIAGAGHFVPEQRGAELGRLIADFVAST